jgi:hypothetical protein
MLKNNKGITLIEAVVYIAILSLLLPAMVIFLINTTSGFNKFSVRSRMSSSAQVILSELNYSLSEATVFNTANSVLGANNGVIYFNDKNGNEFSIENVTGTVRFADEDQQINRLRLVDQINMISEWMTDPDINVESFKILGVRNASSTLQGVNIFLNLEGLNFEAENFSANSLQASTTIKFSPHILEL